MKRLPIFELFTPEKFEKLDKQSQIEYVETHYKNLRAARPYKPEAQDVREVMSKTRSVKLGGAAIDLSIIGTLSATALSLTDTMPFVGFLIQFPVFIFGIFTFVVPMIDKDIVGVSASCIPRILGRRKITKMQSEHDAWNFLKVIEFKEDQNFHDKATWELRALAKIVLDKYNILENPIHLKYHNGVFVEIEPSPRSIEVAK